MPSWGTLVAVSLVCILPLQLLHFPAALLLGAMAAAILIAIMGASLIVPRLPYVWAQSLIGCLVARSIDPAILKAMAHQWPLFLAGVASVLVISSTLGALLARWRVLPGSTAVWGSAPGAATVMVLMSENFGGDPRLVAFMQFLRLVLVASLASVVARLWVEPAAVATPPMDWFPALAAGPVWATIAMAFAGALIGTWSGLPAGPLLVPLFAGIVLSGTGTLAITLPPALMACCYVLVGWSIGLRFTREIVRHAARAFWKVLASTITLIVLCAGLAWLLHLIVGTDPLTAFLATSPGGADSVAVIAASAHVDMPFVMAMQVSRFIVVLALGPALARAVARWSGC
jgi:membrane AbrB-like protein